MKRICCIALIAMAALPSVAYGYGEGADIPEGSRVIHLLTNEARTNTKEALANCGEACSEGLDCHQEVMDPVYWDDDLYRAAQFHASMLNAINKTDQTPCMQHNSPCTLKSNAASNFPNKCDGSPSCACEGGKASCDNQGTSASERVKMFSAGYSAENLASTSSTPYGAFMLWLYENAKGDGCKWSMNNGHRFNIFSASKRVGVGYTDAREGMYYGITAQDFNSLAPEETPALTSGAAYIEKGTLWFKTHYFAQTAAQKVTVTIDGVQSELSKTRGTDLNGVYGSSSITEPAKCAEYFFESTDTSGVVTRFPTTGVLLYACETSWKGVGLPDNPGSGDDTDDAHSSSNSDCSLHAQNAPQGALFGLFAILTGLLICLRRRKRT